MHFINETTSDLNLCDGLIAFHKNQTEKGICVEGVVGIGVDHTKKKSLDVCITEDLYPRVSEALQKMADAYIKKFPWCNEYAKWGITRIPQIQYYGPNDGYYAWHTERSNAQPYTQNRHLVYMIYLNDVTDGGGTEFLHQELIVQPVKGKSLIWPVDWTHTHRGIPSPTQDKYILTGWFEFLE
jgi:hypothetical protein